MNVSVSADYEDIERVSRRLNETSDEIRTLLMTIFSHLSVLQSGGWLGTSADAFYDEMDGFMIPYIKQLAGDYEDMAQRVSALVPLFYEMDTHVSVNFNPPARIA